MSHTPQTTDKQRSHMASEIVLSFYTVRFFPVFNVIIVRTHRREMQLFSVAAGPGLETNLLQDQSTCHYP